jgi:hypothetical protein
VVDGDRGAVATEYRLALRLAIQDRKKDVPLLSVERTETCTGTLRKPL